MYYDYIISKPPLDEETLAHYGIKGMKWRRAKNKIAQLLNSNKSYDTSNRPLSRKKNITQNDKGVKKGNVAYRSYLDYKEGRDYVKRSDEKQTGLHGAPSDVLEKRFANATKNFNKLTNSVDLPEQGENYYKRKRNKR